MNKFPPWPVRPAGSSCADWPGRQCHRRAGFSVAFDHQRMAFGSESGGDRQDGGAERRVHCRRQPAAGRRPGKLMALNGWGNMRAVREGRVYVISAMWGRGPERCGRCLHDQMAFFRPERIAGSGSDPQGIPSNAFKNLNTRGIMHIRRHEQIEPSGRKSPWESSVWQCFSRAGPRQRPSP